MRHSNAGKAAIDSAAGSAARNFKDLDFGSALDGKNTAQSASGRHRARMPWGIILALLATLGCLALAGYSFYTARSEMLSIFSLCATVWAGLWTAYLSSRHHESPKTARAAEWSIIVSTFAGLGIWALATRQWGLPMSTADGAAGFAALTVVTTLLMRSTLVLLTSACAGLVWIALHIYVPSIALIPIWIFPVLALAHIMLAAQQGSKSSAFFTLTAAHIWLGWLLYSYVQSGAISVLHSPALAVLIGMAHYRLGKAAGDANWSTSSVHVVFGWVLSMAGLIVLQMYWLGLGADIWSASLASSFGHLAWQIIGTACIALIGIAGIIRLSYRRLSVQGLFFSLMIALAAAVLFDQRAAITALVEAEMLMPAQPLIGQMLGAAILSSAAAMTINGMRKRVYSMVLVGMAVIGIQAVLLLSPDIWTGEAAAAYVIVLVTSLSLTALLASDSAPQSSGLNTRSLRAH